MHYGLSIGILLMFVAYCPPIQGQAADSADASANVVLSDAHTFVQRDPKTQIPYRLYVALPPGYADGLRRYPVLYMLDADAGFALATQAYRLLRVDSAMPDLLLVGIGYDLSGAARRSQRNRHLTPTRVEADSATGEGAAFLNSLVEVIMPAIDSRYRTDPGDRSIFGHSLGGLFALFALLERPDVFRRYIVSSPSLWWDNGVLLRLESQFARDHRSLPKRVFMSVGAEEAADMHERFRPFADSLMSRQYQGLDLTAVVFPEETHLSVFATAFVRGVRAVYR